MLPHSIRLRGPWQVQIEPQPAVQVVLPATPAELGLAAAVGSVWRLLRRFGLPRTLDPHESVWLCLQQVQGLLSLKVNDQSYDCPAEELIEIELGHALNRCGTDNCIGWLAIGRGKLALQPCVSVYPNGCLVANPL